MRTAIPAIIQCLGYLAVLCFLAGFAVNFMLTFYVDRAKVARETGKAVPRFFVNQGPLTGIEWYEKRAWGLWRWRDNSLKAFVLIIGAMAATAVLASILDVPLTMAK